MARAARLSIKGYRSVRDEIEITFPPGQPLVLVGENNAGKSTALLQAAHNYAERGMSALMFIARLDDRAGGRIKSRIGLEAEAARFDAETDFWQLLSGSKANCVLMSRKISRKTRVPPSLKLLVPRRHRHPRI